MLWVLSAALMCTFGMLNVSPFGSNAAEADPDNFRPSNVPYDEFDWQLTKHAASISKQNLLLSPLGLKLSLAALTEAATGVTARELKFVLGLGTNMSHTRAKFENILDTLFAKSNQYTLNLGSRIYVNNNVERVYQLFEAKSELYYKTDLKKADFENPTAAVQDINSWIANITQGRISKLVNEDDVSGAVMLILNTLYFKGTWRHQFEPKNTRFDYFFSTASDITEVPFMVMENNFFYTESQKMDAKILRLPFSGNKFSMYLIVPNSLVGLTRVLSELTAHQLRQEMAFLTTRKVRLMLPRFQFEFASQLDDVLKSLGLQEAFKETASLPGIARRGKYQISRVMQKSGIELNELGSSVHTAPQIGLVSQFVGGEEATVEVQVNRPFLFFIEDENNKQVLFTGRISDVEISPALRPVIFLPLDNI